MTRQYSRWHLQKSETRSDRWLSSDFRQLSASWWPLTVLLVVFTLRPSRSRRNRNWHSAPPGKWSLQRPSLSFWFWLCRNLWILFSGFKTPSLLVICDPHVTSWPYSRWNFDWEKVRSNIFHERPTLRAVFLCSWIGACSLRLHRAGIYRETVEAVCHNLWKAWK